MQHPNAKILEKIYNDFAKGDIPAMLAACDDKVTFEVKGKGKLAGKFTKADVGQKFFGKIAEIAGSDYKLEVHDILASDRHGVVLVSGVVNRGGEKHSLRAAHVWRIENGRPVAWYEYPRDMYAFDAAWN
jgi:uncharacterized protein